MQTQIWPCRGEFFLKINKRACTSIRHTRVFEDFKFKILEGSEQYWSCPGSGLKSKQIWYPLHNVCTLGWVLFTPTLFKYWIFTFGNILNFSKFLHFRKYFEEFISKLLGIHFRKYFEEFISQNFGHTFSEIFWRIYLKTFEHTFSEIFWRIYQKTFGHTFSEIFWRIYQKTFGHTFSENFWAYIFGNILKNLSENFWAAKTFEQRFALPKTFLKFEFFQKLFYWPFYRIDIDISPILRKI